MSSPAVLGLLLARGGSRGVPGKNVRLLGGRPLLAYSVAAARAAGVLDAIVLSTDSEEIARVGRAAGADVPFLRPTELASDSASSEDAALHALSWLHAERGWSPEWLVLLQPTSPFRCGARIREGLALAQAGVDRVIGVVAGAHHPAWMYRVADGGWLVPLDQASPRPTCRQALSQVFHPNGALYVVRTAVLAAERAFAGGSARPLVMGTLESVDIDTPEDWVLAEALLAAGAVETDLTDKVAQ